MSDGPDVPDIKLDSGVDAGCYPSNTAASLSSSHLQSLTCNPIPDSDNARYAGSENYPDGSVVAPGQTLTKAWSVRNTGTTAWGSGYQVVFRSGHNFGTSSAVAIPAAAPGATVNLNVPLRIPDDLSPGLYKGVWQLRNAAGTIFGPPMWYELRIAASAPPPEPGIPLAVEVMSVNVPSPLMPGETFRPEVTVRVNSGQLGPNDMLYHKGGDRYDAHPHVAVGTTVNAGQEHTFRFYADTPMKAPNEIGSYESTWKLLVGGNEIGDDITIAFRVGSGNSRPPNHPTLLGPRDWELFVKPDMPTLCAQDNGDPDGDAITEYYFETFQSAQNWNSGWVSSSCFTPASDELGEYIYRWRAKVRDDNGTESGWSDANWFSIESSTVEVTDFSFDPPSPSNVEPVLIYAKTQGCGGTGIYMKAMVNEAADGSTNGAWHDIKELGVPEFVEADAPRWNTLEFAEGTHIVRIEVTSCDGSVQILDKPYQLTRARPSRPYPLAPADASWSNDRTITFRWQESLRAQEYRLVVGTTENPEDAPLIDQTVQDTSFTHTFEQPYEQLYWKVFASNELGTTDQGVRTRWFGIDVTPPTAAIDTALTPDLAFENKIPIFWNGEDEHSGIHSYDIQVRKPYENTWTDWLTDYRAVSSIFSGQNGQQYCFRVRARDVAGNMSTFPADDATCITVDPTQRPPQVWWNDAYQFRRNLVLVNRMDGVQVPNGYPIAVRFTDQTDPTAQEIYDASQAATKGADVRVVYDNTTEVPRWISTFTPSEVVIRFPLRAGLATSDQTNYAVYYGNAAAGNPSVDLADILVPKRDTDTRLLMAFEEGRGTTVRDLSGHNNPGTLDGAVSWQAGRYAEGLDFNGGVVRINDSNSLRIGGNKLTVEAWFKLDTIENQTRNLVAKFTPDTDPSWRLFTRYDEAIFRLTYPGQAGISVSTGREELQAGRWHHLAGVYDGQNVCTYLDGVRKRCSPYTTPLHAGTSWVSIGDTGYRNGEHFLGQIDQVRVTAKAYASFPYALITTDPQAAAGGEQKRDQGPPIPGMGDNGHPDIAIQNFITYPLSNTSMLVKAEIANTGVFSTVNDVTVFLTRDTDPSAAITDTTLLHVWENAPIAAGDSVSLTAVLTDVVPLTPPLQHAASALAATPASIREVTSTLALTVDPFGTLPEGDSADAANNEMRGYEVCVATSDGYDDDTVSEAVPLIANQAQNRNTDYSGDTDWVQFEATAGITYTISTSNLGTIADTYLTLYDTDGTTVLTTSDDYDGSLASYIEWGAPETGTYYVQTKQWNPAVGGCGTTYELHLVPSATDRRIYLPLLQR